MAGTGGVKTGWKIFAASFLTRNPFSPPAFSCLKTGGEKVATHEFFSQARKIRIFLV